MSLQERQVIQKAVTDMHKITEIPVVKLVRSAKIPLSTWQDWQNRLEQPTHHNSQTPKQNWVTVEEENRIVNYAAEHFNRFNGYRYLTNEMIDNDIAYVCPSTVYNILKKHGLIQKWASNSGIRPHGYNQPFGPNMEWHTDISYVKVCGKQYYFSSIMDGYSRKILNWQLVDNMESNSIEILVTETRERFPDCRPAIIHDNGSQFISKNFKQLMNYLILEDRHTKPAHPQSNGKLERFHKTLKKRTC